VAYRGALVGEMGYKVFRQKVDGSNPPEILLGVDAVEKRPRGFTDGGESLLLEICGHADQQGLWSLAWHDPKALTRLVPGFFEEPSFAPDGRFFVYQSGQFGSMEVYVQALEDAGRRVQVSVDGGRIPRWSRDGRCIYFLNGERFVAAAFGAGERAPDCGSPEPLFERPGVEGYDVSPDGNGFLTVERLPDSGLVHQIELVTGWFEELRRLSPAGERGFA
jgi:hypothetical protein